MLTFIAQICGHGLLITGEMIQQRPLIFAKMLYIMGFTGSNRSLQRFKKRNNLTFKWIIGERVLVPEVSVNDWKENITYLLNNYSQLDIYNADEKDLFLQGY